LIMGRWKEGKKGGGPGVISNLPKPLIAAGAEVSAGGTGGGKGKKKRKVFSLSLYSGAWRSSAAVLQQLPNGIGGRRGERKKKGRGKVKGASPFR